MNDFEFSDGQLKQFQAEADAQAKEAELRRTEPPRKETVKTSFYPPVATSGTADNRVGDILCAIAVLLISVVGPIVLLCGMFWAANYPPQKPLSQELSVEEFEEMIHANERYQARQQQRLDEMDREAEYEAMRSKWKGMSAEERERELRAVLKNEPNFSFDKPGDTDWTHSVRPGILRNQDASSMERLFSEIATDPELRRGIDD